MFSRVLRPCKFAVVKLGVGWELRHNHLSTLGCGNVFAQLLASTLVVEVFLQPSQVSP